MKRYYSVQYVILVSLSIQGTVNNMHIKLTFMGNTSTFCYVAATESCCNKNVIVPIKCVSFPPNTCSTVDGLQQETTFIGPVNSSPVAKSPSAVVPSPLLSCTVVS